MPTQTPTQADQDKMLNFVSDWVPRDASWNMNTDVCAWAGVGCEDGRVTSFRWTNTNIKGSIDAFFMPRMMTSLDLSDNAFTSNGTYFFNLLQNLTTLVLARNLLTTFAMEPVPYLKHLDLSGNNINTTFEPQQLPSGLTYLDFSFNHYCCSYLPTASEFAPRHRTRTPASALRAAGRDGSARRYRRGRDWSATPYRRQGAQDFTQV